MPQLGLPRIVPQRTLGAIPHGERLARLLDADLDFHGEKSGCAVHGWHAFPAKFPPQLPQKFTLELTEPGDVVLDPMMGSGTTLVEAAILGRTALGTDIDPLSIRVVSAKLRALRRTPSPLFCRKMHDAARNAAEKERCELEALLERRFDPESREFVNYWFSGATQIEIMALVREIEKIQDAPTREFLLLVLSSIIITKSGGVSLALDLAHTRPHKSKDKAPNSAIEEFGKRLNRMMSGATLYPEALATVVAGNARNLPFSEASIDLIVTSPPYASNAIDYMRAHKFSLVWFGHGIRELGLRRRMYVGSEQMADPNTSWLPPLSDRIVRHLGDLDPRKAKVLCRYYVEMRTILAEMRRVLKPGRAAVVVVGNSQMRGISTETHECLAELGVQAGLSLTGIGKRRLDRDKRMMPARWKKDHTNGTQIEERMHEEFVIGFLKPERK